ncbi:MAG: cupin domain-containing protein, partial [Halieaceae bacterium]|nr:cupin domain-containing protein [Halieaceae bacterium]
MAASGGASAVDVDTLIEALGLEAHVEGGYFRRIFQADHRDRISTPAGERYTLTSIHYLLTADSPVGHWHLNRSDIVHYFHLGAPITYYLIHPDGRLETVVMGSDVARGQQLALVVRGGTWKAS